MKGNGLEVYSDGPLWASLAVEGGGKLRMVPKSPDGWKRRLPLAMTSEARDER